MNFEQRANDEKSLWRWLSISCQSSWVVYTFQRWSWGHKWRWTYGPPKISDQRKLHRNCAWIYQKWAEIIFEIHGIGFEYLQNIDLSHFNRSFGLTKGLCTFCSPQVNWWRKMLRIQHSKDIIKEARKDENFLYNIVTDDETWCFQYEPVTKRQSAKLKAPDEPPPKKSRLEKSKIKSMLICFYDSKGIVHKEFVPTGQTVNAIFYLGVLKRLLHRIRRIRPEYREGGSWRLLHDNAPSHRSTLATDFLTRNRILTINHSSYSPDSLWLLPIRKIPFGHERKTFCVRRGHWNGLYRHPEGHSGQWPETLSRKAFGSCKTVYRGRRELFWINKLEFIRTKLLSFLF